MAKLDRRRFLSYCSAAGLTGTLFPGILYDRVEEVEDITVDVIAEAEKIAGLSFTEEEREMLVEDLQENLEAYSAIREVDIPNELPPARTFDPTVGGIHPTENGAPFRWQPEPVDRPQNDEDLAFMSVAELSYLLKNRDVTARKLTELYLDRLKHYDSVLEAVITFTEDLAWEQAERADAELDAGDWRGPLHGVPYGAKDLLAVEGYPTTWGAVPYRDQEIDATAAVVDKLDEAGAILVAKMTLGALAWGDVWFDGQTKNPWNIEQGASGSSAGSGAAVSAGLVGFAIGSETLGSIVSPSTRNGVTGFRPSFGAVSRHGAMALSWSMDKLGPMARTAEDCALVYNAIYGKDERDPSTRATSFPYDQHRDATDLRVGYFADAFDGDYDGAEADADTLNVMRDIGFDLVEVALPDELPVGAMLNILYVEAATAFDQLTRERGIDDMVRQGRNAWPHVFRTARFVPAVEHEQMERLRTRLARQMADALSDVDVFVSPSFRGNVLGITNLTGHPCVCVPNRFDVLEDAPRSARRDPGSISFIGELYQDADALTVARAYQEATGFHLQRPPIE